MVIILNYCTVIKTINCEQCSNSTVKLTIKEHFRNIIIRTLHPNLLINCLIAGHTIILSLEI